MANPTSRISLALALGLALGCGGPGVSFEEPGSGPGSSDQTKSPAPPPAPPGDVPADEPKDDGAAGGDAVADEPPPPQGPTLPPLPSGPPVELPRTRSLFWSWPCAGETRRAAPSDPSSLVVEGAGEFLVELGARDVLGLEIAGSFCKPDAAPRDVLFVVDASSSMRSLLNGGHDPLKNGTCERVKAVDAVLATLGADARASLVTFSDDVKADAGGFLTPAELKAKLVNAATLCDRGSGTNYKKALARAEALVLEARPGAATEVYLISDGQPSSDREGGMAEAERIRLRATIATLIVGGEGAATVLQDGIASRDLNGEPLHAAIGSVTEMAATLAQLAHAPLAEVVVTVNGVAVTFDPTGGTEYRVSDLRFERAAFPDGLALTVELRDVRGRLMGGRGLLKAK